MPNTTNASSTASLRRALCAEIVRCSQTLAEIHPWDPHGGGDAVLRNTSVNAIRRSDLRGYSSKCHMPAASVDKFWPKVGKGWPNLSQVRPKEVKSNLANFGRNVAEFGGRSAKVAQTMFR